MSEIRDLFERAAGDDPVGFDHRDVAARVGRRRRRQRMLPAAVLVVVALIGAAAWFVFDPEDAGVVVSGSSDPGVDELTADRWVAFRLGTVTQVDGLPWIDLDADGTLMGYDGCALFEGDWSLTDSVLDASTEWTFPSMPGCPGPGTGLRELLDDGAVVGRPSGVDDQLGLVSAGPSSDGGDPPLGVTFRRFDRLGEVPTDDDLAGTWNTDDGTLGAISVTFEPGGTARFAASGCDVTGTWGLDGEVLELGEGRSPGCLVVLANEPPARVRLATDPEGVRTLHISDEVSVTTYHLDT